MTAGKVQESPVYLPINVLKPLAPEIWMVDGPTIQFGVTGFKMPFPTRMIVIRMVDGGLFVHSPTALTEGLRKEIEALGPVRHVIAPNRIHYWWIPTWRQAYPDAHIWLAPHVRERAGDHIDFETEQLTGPTGYPWDGEIETLPVESRYMTEVVFFHRASRTLVLTDLIENFEGNKIGPLMRCMACLGGVLDPHGSMPRDMRLTFLGRRKELKAVIEQMIALVPERVIIAHGRWYASSGTEELRRAFAWLL